MLTVLDYEIEAVPYGEVKTPEWQEHQPFAQMPWMEDTEAGIELYESRAISRCASEILLSYSGSQSLGS